MSVLLWGLLVHWNCCLAGGLAGVAPEAPETISLVSDDDEDDPYEESSGSDEEPIVADDDEEEEDSMGSEELLVDENGDVID